MNDHRRQRVAESVAIALLGALHTLAYVRTGAWPLAVACTALLAWRVGRATPGRAAWLGLAYGSAWLGAGVWWLFISMHRYGGLPAPVAALAVALLSVALSGYLALAMVLLARARRGHVAWDAGLFAIAWLGAELARGLIFTGFPWVASGYALVDAPLASAAPWIGVYGLGALVALAAALLAAPGWIGRLVALALLLGPALLPPPQFSAPTGTLHVVLLQTNVAQDEKFAIERLPAALAWVGRALRSARGDLVVAPETAVPLLPDQLDQLDANYWALLVETFRAPGAAQALVGVPLGDFRQGYTNSVVGLSALPGEYRYDKAHLVPFGEFIPTGFRWFTELMNIPLGDFNRGRVPAPSFVLRGGERVAPNICYEDLFGEELALRFTDPAQAPTLMVNLSNIGWFGDTIAIEQHLNISRMRTLELQRPMLRATNTGATALIDHRGRVLARLPSFSRGALEVDAEGRSGTTPYAAWVGAVGLWPLLVASWAALAVAALRGRRPSAGPVEAGR